MLELGCFVSECIFVKQNMSKTDSEMVVVENRAWNGCPLKPIEHE